MIHSPAPRRARHALWLASLFAASLLAVSLLAACGTDPVPAADPLPAGDATYTHTPSGFVFPAMVDRFRRVEVSRQDPQGQSATVVYTLDAAGPITATVHVYPAHVASGAFAVFHEPEGLTPGHSAPELATVERELARLHPSLQVVAREDAFLVQGGVEQSGRELVATFDDAAAGVRGRMTVDAYAFCCRAPNHAVVYRFQYPQGAAATAAAATAMFMRDLPGAPQ